MYVQFILVVVFKSFIFSLSFCSDHLYVRTVLIFKVFKVSVSVLLYSIISVLVSVSVTGIHHCFRDCCWNSICTVLMSFVMLKHCNCDEELKARNTMKSYHNKDMKQHKIAKRFSMTHTCSIMSASR